MFVHQSFEAEVLRNPLAIAISSNDGNISYGALNAWANRVAQALLAHGIQRDQTIGIHLDRSAAMVAAVLGVLKAGGAYVPLELSLPGARLAFIVESARVNIILANSVAARFAPASVWLDVGTCGAGKAGDKVAAPRIELFPLNLAYVLFTSGSTGAPKGVMVSHEGLSNYVTWAVGKYRTGRRSVPLNSALGFDLTITSLFCPLISGGCVILLPDDADKASLAVAIANNPAFGLIKLTPSHLKLLNNQITPAQILDSAQTLVIGGEALYADILEPWRRQAPATRLINEYGPTETVVGSCFYEVDARDNASGVVPIGRPISNTTIHLLGADMSPVPQGAPGEVYIGGKGVSRGYLARPSLTAERFVPDPFSTTRGARLFRTGDLGRQRVDGNLEYLGRIDRQMKIRGFRIEPGEIEAVLKSHAAVRDVSVLPRSRPQSELQLVAYVVPNVAMPRAGSYPCSFAAGRVEEWRSVFQSSFRAPTPNASPKHNLAGWISSYTAAPIDDVEMEAWTDRTVDLIRALRPKRILEVGCGTGLLLLRLAESCERYDGMDFSGNALDFVRRQLLARSQLSHVRLFQREATDLNDFSAESYDLVILNSVVQYFPGVDYLERVLSVATKLVRPGGRIFVGDVRSLPLLRAFHLSVELHNAADELIISGLETHICQAIDLENELVLDPSFFDSFCRTQTDLGAPRITLKRGQHANEMTLFRYDVVFSKAAPTYTAAPRPIVQTRAQGWTIEQVEQWLASSSEDIFCFRDAPNLRVLPYLAASRLLAGADPPKTVGELREIVNRMGIRGVDPETVCRLGQQLGFAVDILWPESRDPECFDAVFQRESGAASGDGTDSGALMPPTRALAQPARLANDPLKQTRMRKLRNELRKHLGDRLPAYMIPSAFVFVDSLPVTIHGKLDEAALHAMSLTEIDAGESYAPPTTAIATAIAEVWAEALGRERVGLNENFFEIGGDSIVSVLIVSRLARRGIHLRAGDVLLHPTIDELAELARPEKRAGSMAAASSSDTVALTPVQCWFFEQNLASPSHWNQSMILDMLHDVNCEALRQALSRCAERHDALRLRFAYDGSAWRQRVAPAADLPLQVIEVPSLALAQMRETVENACASIQSSLDISDGPIARAAVFNFRDARPSQLLLVVHHLAIDTVSWPILLEDLQTYYECGLKGADIRLPAATTSFQTWARLLTEYARSDAAARDSAYWLQRRAPAETELRLGQRPGRNLESDACEVSFGITAAETDSLLHVVPAVTRTYINDVLLAALSHALIEPDGSHAVLIDLEGHGREEIVDADSSQTIGWFTAVYPVCLTQGPDRTPLSTLTTVKEILRAIPNKGLGYGILRYLCKDDTARQIAERWPDAEVSFNYLGQTDLIAGGNTSFSNSSSPSGPVYGPRNARRYLLDVEAQISRGQLGVRWIFSPSQLRRETIERAAKRFVDALREIITTCLTDDGAHARPSDFPLASLSNQELNGILAGGPVEDIYSLTPAQEGILFEGQLSTRVDTYLIQSVITLTGEVDRRSFEAAWRNMLERHAVLRTCIANDNGAKAVQVVRANANWGIDFEDWRRLTCAQQDEALKARLMEGRLKPFDLQKPPLWSLTAIQREPELWTLVFTAHHLLLDGWSSRILLHEFIRAYDSIRQGRMVSLPPTPPFKAYVEWAARQTAVSIEDRDYWIAELSGAAPSVAFAYDLTHPERSAAPSMTGETRGWGEVELTASAGLTAALREAANTYHLTISTFIQAAWAILLSYYTQTREPVFGVIVATRPPEIPDVTTMVGLLINAVPVRVRIRPDATIMSWLQDLQARQACLRQHDHVPLAKILDLIDHKGSPLFESLVVINNYPQEIANANAASLNVVEIRDIETSHYPLNLLVVRMEPLTLRIAYSDNRLLLSTVEQMAEHLRSILSQMSARPTAHVGQLDLLTPEEQTDVALRKSASAPDPTVGTLVDRFEAQVAASPKAAAVMAGAATLSYERLDAQANQLAHELRRHGIGAEARVAFCMERSPLLIVALLGIIKAGAAYVPLDPESPPDRLGSIAEMSGARLVLTERTCASQLRKVTAPVLALDDEWSEIARLDQHQPGVDLGGDNLALVVYTSGSTGEPKGVAVTHRAVLNLFADGDFVRFSTSDTVAQGSTLAFDAATFEIWGALLHGAMLVILPKTVMLDPSQLERQLLAYGVTILFLTTSLFNEMARAGVSFDGLATLVFGGEIADASAIAAVRSRAPHLRLLNGYGPTETTTFAAWFLVRASDTAIVPIGRPLKNHRLYILDASLRAAPAGQSGELYIAGEGLARGYLNRPNLTAERFLPDAYAGNGSRMYRTGDIARRNEDGAIVVLGRLDAQLKIRGIRIEPREIEAVLSRHPGVRSAVILGHQDHLELILIAYVQMNAGFDFSAEGLRMYAAQHLPAPMAPTWYMPIQSWPLSPNGKLDLRALPMPQAQQPVKTVAAPKTVLQQMLSSLWEDVLDIACVSLHDDFFALGGHSLTAARLASRMRKTFGLDLPLRLIFDAPTLAGQADEIERLIRGGKEPSLPPIAAVAQRDSAPLSFAQERLWILEQFAAVPSPYAIGIGYRVHGPLDPVHLQGAVSDLIERHSLLRTTFHEVEGALVQRIGPSHSAQLAVDALELLDPEEAEAEINHISSNVQQPFDLRQGPLARFRLVRLEPEHYLLIVGLHHIVTDGWSQDVLGRDLWELYAARREGRPARLTVLSIQFSDFAEWQRRCFTPEVLQVQARYWRDQLSSAPPLLELPVEARPLRRSTKGAVSRFTIPSDLAPRLRALVRGEGVTMAMALLSVYACLLHRYAGQDDIVIGIPTAGRNNAAVEPLIGLFVNTLVLRIDCGGSPSFATMLGRVRETLLAAWSHQDLPFDKLVEMLAPERDLRHAPVFQVGFDFQEPGNLDIPGLDLTVESFALRPEAAQVDLYLTCRATAEGIDAEFEYATDLFEGASIQRMIEHYCVLLRSAVKDPQRAIDTLAMITSIERRRLLEDWNETGDESSLGPFAPEMVLGQALAEAQAAAIVENGTVMSYGELAARVEDLAIHLRVLGVGPETLVAILMRRSADMIVALLAVLRAGGGYLPLDPSSPADRLGDILRNSRVSLLLTRSFDRRLEAPPTCRIVEVDRLGGAPAGTVSNAPHPVVHAENVAYVIYTSGSTGRPKGVVVTHRGLRNMIAAQVESLGMAPGDRVLQFASLSFDASVFEIFAALTVGATLVIASEERILPGRALTTTLQQTRITMATLPPSAIELLDPDDLPELRTVISAGEPCPAKLAKLWKEHVFLNAYGPTETTVWATLFRASQEADRLPIGRPIRNMRVHVLDAQLELAPVGVLGEIYIGGEGVSRGYLDMPALTAARFLPDPFAKAPGGRIYRTGDFARWRADGVLDFAMRRDRLVKLRGYRVELGEIESALLEHPGISETAVLAPVSVARHTAHLVAFFAQAEARQIPIGELRAFLAARLPHYMIPSRFIQLDALPKLPSGKRDYLSMLKSVVEQPRTEPRPPDSTTEALVVNLFRDILRLGQVEVTDNFFEIGGQSLLAVQLAKALGDLFEREISVLLIFQFPTPELLARELAAPTQPRATLDSVAQRASRRLDAQLVSQGIKERRAP